MGAARAWIAALTLTAATIVDHAAAQSTPLGGRAPTRRLNQYTRRSLVIPKGRLRIDLGPADFGLLKNNRGVVIFRGPKFKTATAQSPIDVGMPVDTGLPTDAPAPMETPTPAPAAMEPPAAGGGTRSPETPTSEPPTNPCPPRTRVCDPGGGPVVPPTTGTIEPGSRTGAPPLRFAAAAGALSTLGNDVQYQRSSDGDANAFAGIGLAYGVTDWLELGGVLIPVAVAPSFQYGDVDTYGRASLYADDRVEVGVQLGALIPVQTNWVFSGGVPMRLHMNDTFALDLAAQLQVALADPETIIGLSAPLALNASLVERAFIGMRTGLSWFDVSDSELLQVLLGVQTGVSLGDGLVDLTGWFEWPALYTPNAASGDDTLHLDFWSFGVGATFWANLFGSAET